MHLENDILRKSPESITIEEKKQQMMVARTQGLPITGSVALYLQMGVNYLQALEYAGDVDVYIGEGAGIDKDYFKYYVQKRQKVRESGAEVVTETSVPDLEKRLVTFKEDPDGRFIHTLVFINDIVKDNCKILADGITRPSWFFVSEEKVWKTYNRLVRLHLAKPYIKGLDAAVYKLKEEVDGIIKSVIPVLENRLLYTQNNLSKDFFDQVQVALEKLKLAM